ncbi:unnamed protein product [Pylaiella littoralis]
MLSPEILGSDRPPWTILQRGQWQELGRGGTGHFLHGGRSMFGYEEGCSFGRLHSLPDEHSSRFIKRKQELPMRRGPHHPWGTYELIGRLHYRGYEGVVEKGKFLRIGPVLYPIQYCPRKYLISLARVFVHLSLLCSRRRGGQDPGRLARLQRGGQRHTEVPEGPGQASPLGCTGRLLHPRKRGKDKVTF